jgi:DNA-binding Lrp family transcriptional regulator
LTPTELTASILGCHVQQQPPWLVPGVANEELHPTIGLRGEGATDYEVSVGDPTHHPGVFGHLGQPAGGQIKAIDVVELGVVPIEADEQLVGEALVGLDDLDLHTIEGRQIPDASFLQVHGVQPPVLVAPLVLHIEQMPAIVGPEEGPDTTILVVGHHLGFVDAIEGSDPDVEDAPERGNPGQKLAIRRNARTDPLRVAEENLAGNERSTGHNDQGTAQRATRGPPGYHAPGSSNNGEAALAVSAYILIQTEVGKAAQVASEVRQIDGVVSAEDVTGPYDVIVRAEANSVDDLGKMVVSRVQLIDGITRTLTCPVVNLG